MPRPPRHPEFHEDIPGEPQEELFNLLASVFEAGVSYAGYATSLNLPVSPNNPLFVRAEISQNYQLMFGYPLASHRAWTAEIGQVPGQPDKLGFTLLRMPLKSPDEQAAVFERIDEDYFQPLIEVNGERFTLNSRHDPSVRAPLVTTAYIEHTLGKAGYTLPQIFTSPVDVQLALASLRDVADSWNGSEMRTFSEGPNLKITISRATYCVTLNEGRQYRTALSATYEYTAPDLSRKSQTIITFEGEGALYNTVVIRRRELVLSDLSKFRNDTLHYNIVSNTVVKGTENPDALNDLVDELRDNLEPILYD